MCKPPQTNESPMYLLISHYYLRIPHDQDAPVLSPSSGGRCLPFARPRRSDCWIGCVLDARQLFTQDVFRGGSVGGQVMKLKIAGDERAGRN